MSNRPRRVLVCLDCPICADPAHDELWPSRMANIHPHCEACSILMGAGHLEWRIARYCDSCIEAYHKEGAFHPELPREVLV